LSKLTGKVAVVTGASKGIGAAIAKALAAEGASVVVNYASSKAGADTVVAAITAAGGKAVAVPGDVSKAAEAHGTIEAAIRNYGRLDILVNNAGVTAIYPSLELPLEEWKRVLDVNLTGVFLCAQEAAREMIRAKAGGILNIASGYGVVAAPNRAAYCATKAAVAMLTKVLAASFGDGWISCLPAQRDRPTKRTLVKERRSILKQEGKDQEKITTQTGHEEPWRVELIKEPSEGRRARNQANQGTRRC